VFAPGQRCIGFHGKRLIFAASHYQCFTAAWPNIYRKQKRYFHNDVV
jgi:hypothetical protein